MKDVEILRYDNNGRGIGKINDKIIFIDNAIPGEIIKTNIIEEKKNYLIGENIEIIKASDKRIAPKCKYAEKCGGCSLQNLEYKDTIIYKKNKIINLFEKNNLKYEDFEFIENKEPFFYRNKISLKIENGLIGFYENKTHSVVEIDECIISKKSINKVIKEIKKWNLENAEITIRSNYNDEIILNIKTNEDFNSSSLLLNNKVVGMILNNKTIYNTNHFTEKIKDNYFKVSYNAFFQVNNYICEKLFEIVSNNIKEDSIVGDLYCGVGTLSIIESYKAKKVYGIEIVENAIKDAITNAKINKRNNIYFSLGKVENILPKINDKLDTIVVDPPRAGLDKNTINTILEIKPNDIIYISCDPLTLVRDLKELSELYNINKLYILDMFSYTYHTECIILMSKKVI